MLLYLVGYMGSGKTTVGRELARRLDFDFTDTDRLIEQQCSSTVAEIFESEGEQSFREREAAVLESIRHSEKDTVIATGGGLPCFGDNMRLMNESGITVYLKSEPGRLVRRLKHGRQRRPLIRNMDDEQLYDYIEKNIAAREEYYLRSRMVIDCNGVTDHYIIDHILRYINILPK